MGGDNAPTSAPESMASQLASLTSGLPGLMTAINSQLTPTAQATQNATNATAPQQAALQAQLLGQYGPQLTDLYNKLGTQSALGAASTEAQVASSPDEQKLLSTLDAQQRQLSPEYYTARAQTGTQLGNLLGSINLQGLTGSEQSQVERSNAASDAARGTAYSPSQTAVVGNAMNYGTALQQKQQNLGGIIGQATNFMSNAAGPINAQSVFQGVGQPASNTTNSVTNSLAPNSSASSTASGSANSQASGLLGAINSTANNTANINANRRDSLDRVDQTLGSLPSVS